MRETNFYDIYCDYQIDGKWSGWGEDPEIWEWQGDNWQEAIHSFLDEDYASRGWDMEYEVASIQPIFDGQSGIMEIEEDLPLEVSWDGRKVKATLLED